MIGFYSHTVKSDMSMDKVRLAILSAMNSYARQVVKLFKKTVSSWDEEVEFVVVKAFSRAGRMEVMVYTDNQIYQWVDEGTPEHDIFAGIYTGLNDNTMLVYSVPSIPKTKPNKLESGLSSIGDNTIFTPYVHHPGIQPRNFDNIIAKQMKPLFELMMQEAIFDAVGIQ